MFNILLCGAAGKMGRAIEATAAGRNDLRITGRIDSQLVTDAAAGNFASVAAVTGSYDCIIDFSHPSITDALLAYAVDTGTPLVLCTTGLSEQQIAAVRSAAEKIPVFFSANMSLGVNLLCELCKKAVQVLGADFDVEIIEKHHNLKLDAPSGTALMLADQINEAANGRYHYVYNRHSVRQQRDGAELGIHSVRGGNIVGEHEVLFAGHDEQISLRHTATSREVFVAGALSAARFLKDKSAGIYDMGCMIAQ